GTSTAALQMARLLSDLGFKVVCIEINDPEASPSIFRFMDFNESKHYPGGYHIDGIDLFSNDKDIAVDRIISEYEYAVLDLGHLINKPQLHPNIEFFSRAQVQMITSGSSDWDFDRLTSAISAFQIHNITKKLNVLFNFISDQRFSELKKTFTKEEKESFNLNFFHFPYKPNQIEIDAEMKDVLSTVIAEYIPSKKNKSKWKTWLKGK
uniref:hypothetical protein n=1 Tax=Bacillus sp. FJAT-28004 TaxID=1679165 RepID=UPI000B044722